MLEGAKDPGLYDYAPYRGRKKIVWPEGKTCAVWVAPNLEYYEIDPRSIPSASRGQSRIPMWSATATAITATAFRIGAWPR